MAFKVKVFLSTKLRKAYIAVALSLIIYLALFYSIFTAKFMLMAWRSAEDISCYYTSTGDALQSVDVNEFAPSIKSIYFHETSCSGSLNSRQLCAIESAARVHTDYHINVLFTASITKASLEDENVKNVLAFGNVRFFRIHISEYIKGTPVNDIFTSDEFNKSNWKMTHTSDILRLLTLNNWGGMYLDTDVVVAKRLDKLGVNWVARESDENIATGALALSGDEIGRRMVKATLREIQMTFRGDTWGYNGPGAITRVLKSICSITDVALMNFDSCGGLEVYGPDLFYPIPWQNGEEYFQAGQLVNEDAYVYHVWNHLTEGLKAHVDSPYATLATKFCPTTYESYGERFGT